MGIRIDGASDLINATDGSLTIEGQSVNTTGIVTASGGFQVGTAATIYSNGNATYAGIVTASNTTISSMGIGIGAATNGSANYPSVTISGNSGGAIHFEDDGDLMADIYGDASGLTLSTRKTTDVIAFQLNSGSVGEKARFDSSGRLLIGTAANQHGGGDLLQLAAESSTASLGLNRYTANAHPSYINFFKSRNASLSGQTVVQDGDNLGQITWAGSDGTNRAYSAFIDARVDGTPGDGDMPGRLVFSTASDGSESPTERVRIDKNGQLVLTNGSMSTAYTNSICGGTNLELDTSGIIKFRTDTNQRASITDNGLCFGSDSASANALDDYEEGSWTGTIVTGGGTVGNAWYTKIGNVVFVTGNLTSWGDTTSSTAITVSGFPFTCSATSYGHCVFCKHSDAHKNPWIQVASTTGTFLKSSTSTGSCDYMYHSGIVQSSGSASFCVWYSVA